MRRSKVIVVDNASFQFVLFGLVVAAASSFSRSQVWRSSVLLASSIVFLGILAHNFTVLLPWIGFLLLGYAGLASLQRGWSRTLPWTVVAVLFVYLWEKKYTFLPREIFLQFPYFTLGLSYILFRVLHLLIEVEESGDRRHISALGYFLYTINFTTLISGPIQRYEDFEKDQFAQDLIPLGLRTIGLQLERLVRGFFKVNVLALLLQAVQEDALAQMWQPSSVTAKLYPALRLAVVYPFFLYANFSGYIDIVIAIARLMRVRVPENFNRPFSATSFLEFWSRWHITLSNWLKTYVYNPLLIASMRRISSPAAEPLLGVACFFATFFLVGLWHGRTSEFFVFGLLQGGGVAINKLWQLGLTRILGRKRYKELASDSFYQAFARGLTFSWFALTLIWFWGTWQQIGKLFAAIGGLRWAEVWLAVWFSATFVLTVWESLRGAILLIRTSEGPVFLSRYARVVYASALGFSAFLMTAFLKQPAPEIIYKVF